jgi:hypothetical protein
MKASTKKNAVHSDTKTQPSTDTAALPLANPPPKVGAPVTPTDWKPSKWVGPREGTRPTATQVDAADPAAAELQKSTTYVEDFGANAPPAGQVAQNLLTSSQWRGEWETARNWLAYCSEQRRLWEDQSLADVAALKPAWDYAVSRDPSVAKRYPSTKLLVGARSEVAARAGAKRKAANAAKKAAAAQSPSPPAATPAAAAKSSALN